MNYLNKKAAYLFLCVLFLTLFSVNLFAQSNDIVDQYLLEEEASFGKTAYFVMVLSSLVPDDASIENAINAVYEQGWKIDPKASDQPVKLGELSLMLMKSLNINGGLMYRITKNGRYACRELSYMGLITGDKSPYRTLSGEEALSLISRVLEWKQNNS